MNLKKAIKQLIPPLIDTIYHNYKNGLNGFYIWKGVFQNHLALPVLSNSYFDQDLAKETADYTRSLLERLKNQKRIPYHINDENAFLPLISAVILKNKKKISVLDLGGGMGIGFISLLSCIEDIEELDYFVIETPVMCVGGSQLFTEDKRIHFLSEFPSKLPAIDIVFINSALQYFEHYLDILKRLASYNPEYFLFIKFSAGHIPTYASAQRNLRGTTSAYWFFNVEEIIEHLSLLGYSLNYKSSISRVYDQDNFPEEYRLHNACNLLFSKNRSS